MDPEIRAAHAAGDGLEMSRMLSTDVHRLVAEFAPRAEDDLDHHGLSSRFGRCASHLDIGIAVIVDPDAALTVSDEPLASFECGAARGRGLKGHSVRHEW